MNKSIRIATRKSPLALWQAEFIKAALLKHDPDLNIVFIGLTTQGDREQTKSLADMGGKSLFVKELQQALLSHDADIAVHSIKDLSVQDCPGLTLGAVCKREDPRDAFVSARFSSLQDLPKGAVVGTASPRRSALIKAQRPDLNIKMLRGNVGTRLEKGKTENYDAIILAVAGLKRLNFEEHITDYLDPKIFIPAIGQGAIGIECREEDSPLKDLIAAVHHAETAFCIAAERAVNRVLGGDCHTPVAAHATIDEGKLHIDSMVASLEGDTILHSHFSGPVSDASQLGQQAGQELLDKGAVALLNKDKPNV